MSVGFPCVYYVAFPRARRIYVGSSTDVVPRWARHVKQLRDGKHHSKRLQASYDELGERAMKFGILEWVGGLDALAEREAWWIDYHINKLGRANVLNASQNVAPLKKTGVIQKIA